MPFLALLAIAFSWAPLDHAVRDRPSARLFEKPWYIASSEQLVDPSLLEFYAAETASPVIDTAQTRLYVALRDGRVDCFFRGSLAWTWAGPGAILSAPLLDEATDSLYVSVGGGALVALNRITGAQRWVLEQREEFTTTPTLSEGRLFVMSSDEAVTAVEAATGKSLWKYRRERPAGFSLRGNARPAAGHGLVYAAFADGHVAALQPSNGVARWVRSVSGTGEYLDIDSIAVPAEDERLFVASAKSGISALDARSGEVLWSHELVGANHVVVDGPRLYATGRGAIVGLSRRDGKELWKQKLQSEQFATEPVAMSGLLLVSQDRGSLIALDPRSGKARAVLDPGSGFSQAAAVVPGAAFILSNNGTLFSLGLLP